MKIVMIEGAWLLLCCTEFQLDISNRLWIIVVWKLESRSHTHTYIRMPVKIIFLDVLDHSEYSDTNISIFFFHENSEEAIQDLQVAYEFRLSKIQN